MGGLIFGAALKGLGDAGSSLGGTALNLAAREDELRMKGDLQRELLADKLETQREIAAERAAARGAGGSKEGPFLEDVKPGSMAEEAMANRLGMSVPELRALRAANASGDLSAYGTDVTTRQDADPENSDAVSRRATKTDRRVTGATRDWLQAKRAALAEIQQEYIYGGKYDDVTKGRRTEIGNKVAGGIINGEIDAEEGAKTIAATEGKGSKKESGGVVYDEFTGANDATPVGRSTIGKNAAEAAKDNATAEQKRNGQDPERLKLITDLTQRERTLRTQMGRLAADPIISNDIKKGRAPQAYVEMQDELASVLEQRKALEIGIVKPRGDNGDKPAPGKKERPPLSNFMKR